MVRDLGSRHGTFVNWQPVASEVPLLPGDELCVGLSHFVAVYDLSKPLSAAIIKSTAPQSGETADKLLACVTL